MKKLSARAWLYLAVAVAAMLMILANRCGGQDSGTPSYPTVPTPTTSGSASTAVSPSATAAPRPRDDGVVPPTGASATTSPSPEGQVREASATFAAAWLNAYGRTDAQWYATVIDLVTDDLAEQLPASARQSVPTGVVGDQVTVAPLGQGGLWEADVPVLAERRGQPVGRILLTLTQGRGGWLVDEIDWEPRR